MRKLAPIAAWLALATPASAQTITEFPLPAGSGPTFLTSGHDGNLWLLEPGTNKVAIVRPSGLLEGERTIGADAFDIQRGPGGAMYWTARPGGGASYVFRYGPDGQMDSLSPGPSGSSPAFAVDTGPDGNIWMTAGAQGYSYRHACRLAPALSGGQCQNAAVTGTPRLPDISPGPDGKLWITSEQDGYIRRITPALAYDLDLQLAPGAQPFRITAGPDGAMWFTDPGRDLIGRVTPTGFLREAPLQAGSDPTDIVAGPDGALWFTLRSAAGNSIARMTTDGVVTNEYAVPTAGAEPWGIAVGPDGNIWFTERAAHKVARLELPRSAPGPGGDTADRTAPAFAGRVTMARRVFRVGRAATPITAQRRRKRTAAGTTFRFALSEPARVTISIQRKVRGRRVRGRCKPRVRRGRRCTLWRSAGKALTRQGLQGPNSVAFSGRIGRTALRPGSYRAGLQAVDAAGNRSRLVRVSFKVVKR